MEVVPHDAVRKNSHGYPAGRFGEHQEERAKVAWLVKQRLAVIAAIENVLHKTVG